MVATNDCWLVNLDRICLSFAAAVFEAATVKAVDDDDSVDYLGN